MMNGGSLVQPHVVKAIGDHETGDRADSGQVIDAEPVDDADRDDEPRRHDGAVLPRPDAGPGLRRRRQDRAPPRSGTRRRTTATAPGRSTSSTTRSSATSAARRASRISSSRSRSRRARRRRPGRPPRDAGHVVRAVPPHRDRRDHDARPAARPTAPTPRRPTAGPVTVGLCDTGARDRRRSVDPGRGQARAPALTADDLVRLTGGRLLARSDRPIRGAAVDSRLVEPGNLFVALPGERTDGHAFLGRRRSRRGAAARPRRRGPIARPVGARRRRRVVRVADPLAALGALAAGWRRRFDPLVVGITGSIAKTSTKEAVAAVLGGALPDAAQRGQPEQRDRPAADASCGSVRSTRRPSSRWGCTSAARSPTWPRIGAAADRRRDRGPAGPPVADRLASRRSRRPRASSSRRCRPDGAAILNADDPIVPPDGGARPRARSLTYGFADDADVARRGGRRRAGLDGMRFTLARRRRAPAGRRSRPSAGCRSTTRWPRRPSGSRAGAAARRDRRRASARGWSRAAPGRRSSGSAA